jgi:hypothetical protein
MKRLGVGLVAATVVLGLLPLRAMADPCPSPLGCGDDLASALSLEKKIDDHMVWGQVVEGDFASPDRAPGTIVDVGAWGDSGLWTGTYMAAESYRYAIARARTTGQDEQGDNQQEGDVQHAADPFWAAQQAEAKARIDTMVAKFHLLTNIARGWKTTLSPSVDPANPTKPSFGGGVIQGEPGMLMRACAPTDAPAKWDMPPNGRVFGPFPWEDGKQYVCETAPSRDTYAGVTFGLLTAFDLVSKDDPAMRALIRDDVLTLANFLVKYGWNYPRPHGNVSLPPFGHDFDNFVSPLFVYVPMARLNMAQAARHVAAVAGSANQRAQWEAVWTEELATQGPILAASMEVDSVQPNSGYYKFNLHHLTSLTLSRLEQNPAVQLLIKQAVGVMDKTTRDDVNAHFEAITYALTGEQPRLDAALQHLREWRAYRSRIDAGGETNNASKCGVSIACVPDDQLDVMVDAAGTPVTDLTVPGTVTKLRSRSPLPVADRPPTDFLWQRPPTQLNGGTSATHEAPGVDYLLPYWMLRYYTEVAPPTVASFPAWPGPSHQ